MEEKIKTRKDLIESISIFLIGIGIIIIILSLTVFSSAIYPGQTETYPNEMGIINLVYAVVDNSSPINILVEINSTNITITIPADAIPDSYSLVFIENITNTITKTITQTIHTGGGGSSKTKYVDRNITNNIPIYTDVEVIKEIPTEVEKKVYTDAGFKLWSILVSLIIGAIIMLVVIYFINKQEE